MLDTAPPNRAVGGFLTSLQNFTLIQINACLVPSPHALSICMHKRREDDKHMCSVHLVNFSMHCHFFNFFFCSCEDIETVPMMHFIRSIISCNSEEGRQWTQSTLHDCGSGSDEDRCLAQSTLEHSPAPTWTQPEHPAGIHVSGWDLPSLNHGVIVTYLLFE